LCTRAERSQNIDFAQVQESADFSAQHGNVVRIDHASEANGGLDEPARFELSRFAIN